MTCEPEQGSSQEQDLLVALAEHEEVVLVLSVVDWSGEERARMAVRTSDQVSSGQLQIAEQTGVAVEFQRLVLGDVELEGGQTWASLNGIQDGSVVQLTVVVNEVSFGYFCCY